MGQEPSAGRRDVSTTSSQFRDALRRLFTHVGMRAKAKVAELAQSLADACTREPLQTGQTYRRGQSSTEFADLPAYAAIVKYRDFGKLFKISDPFYRSHDARTASETWMQGRRYVNFASYDYLGLNYHPAVAAAARAAIERFGTSVSASRIVAGERPLHRELETALADFYGVESAVAFVSGHATNVSTIGTLMSGDDLIIHDELAHNSVIVGAKLSRATVHAFRHNDPAALERVLAANRHLHKRALIVVEGLYSMDGDVADLPKLIALKEQYDAWLMVDEAHALGVLGSHGRGSAEHFGVDPSQIDIWMGTLSKTLAACGGYIAGKQELIDILKYQAPGLVYSVGLSPPLAAAAAAALRVVEGEPERIERLQRNGKLFLALAKAAGLDTATSEGHSIVSVIVGDLVHAGKLSQRLLDRGLNVLPIIYPAVPLKASRFRFFITSEHSPAQIHNAVNVMREELSAVERRKVA